MPLFRGMSCSTQKAPRSQSDVIAEKVASRVIQQITEASRPRRAPAKQQQSTGGFFKTLKKGLGFATKLAWLQATEGPDAVSEELLDQLDTFVQKIKASGKVKTGLSSGLYGELEELTKDIRIKKREYERDQQGRFSSSRRRESDDYFV